jgi:uncharacterized protein (UPF0335 family)
MNRYELDKLNEEVKRLTMENEALVDRIERLQERIANLEDIIKDNVYTQGYGDMYVVAKAVHEMQRELKELHPDIFFSNLVYAPNKVGEL